MDELEIVKDLIRIMMFYGIVKGWNKKRLLESYKYLEISEELVNETLQEGF